MEEMKRTDYPMLENHWDEALAFIQESTSSRGPQPAGKVVVHCVAGMNRSVLIVAAYYTLTTQTPILGTVTHIRKQRGNCALRNEEFQEQLVALARRYDLLGPAPGTHGSVVAQVAPPKPAKHRWSGENPLDRLTA